jgi:hypothetical protein
MEIVWGITAVGAPGLFFLGLGLMALPTSPPAFARGCFYTSGGWAGIIGFMWLVSTPESAWWRIAAGLLLGAFVFVLVPQMVRLTYAQTGGSTMTDRPVTPTGHQVPPAIGDNNTVVNLPAPTSMGSGNTFVGPTDSNGNTIFNRGGTAIGSGAQADSTSIAIGAGARAGSPAPETKK